MQKLNLPSYQFKLKSSENKQLIFDIIRKKYVVLTPEEWVRQNFLRFLIEDRNYPISLISIEKQLTINRLKKRFDILIFNIHGVPEIIIECKAPSIKISQSTFDQVARYNMKIHANLLILTNGLTHFICSVDPTKQTYNFLSEIPQYLSKAK